MFGLTWFPGEILHPQIAKKNQACQLCERSLYRAKCWQGAGERDQSISWDPINVNVSNEAGHGHFEVVEIHGTHHGSYQSFGEHRIQSYQSCGRVNQWFGVSFVVGQCIHPGVDELRHPQRLSSATSGCLRWCQFSNGHSWPFCRICWYQQQKALRWSDIESKKHKSGRAGLLPTTSISPTLPFMGIKNQHTPFSAAPWKFQGSICPKRATTAAPADFSIFVIFFCFFWLRSQEIRVGLWVSICNRSSTELSKNPKMISGLSPKMGRLDEIGFCNICNSQEEHEKNHGVSQAVSQARQAQQRCAEAAATQRSQGRRTFSDPRCW